MLFAAPAQETKSFGSNTTISLEPYNATQIVPGKTSLSPCATTSSGEAPKPVASTVCPPEASALPVAFNLKRYILPLNATAIRFPFIVLLKFEAVYSHKPSVEEQIVVSDPFEPGAI